MDGMMMIGIRGVIQSCFICKCACVCVCVCVHKCVCTSSLY